MKKLLIALLILLTFVSCQKKQTVEGDHLARIKAKGEMVIGMEGTWAPWTYHDEKDNLVGYDVEVSKVICDKLGVKATFIEGGWDGLFAGMEAGRYDLIVNGVDIDEEREKKYDFSTPYAFNKVAIIVNETNDSIKSFEDLNGKTTANTLSSTYASIAESYGAKVTSVDDLNQTFQLLLTNRIDATLNAEMTFYDYMKAHPDEKIKVAALSKDATRVAIPVVKGDDNKSLLEAINKALSELQSDGTLTRLSEKYFSVDISK